MSSDSSNSEFELELQKEEKSVAEEDGLRKILASDEEDDEEEENTVEDDKNEEENSKDPENVSNGFLIFPVELFLWVYTEKKLFFNRSQIDNYWVVSKMLVGRHSLEVYGNNF